jgi:hypothetical protein
LLAKAAAGQKVEDTSHVDGMIVGADGMMTQFGFEEYRKYLPKVTPPAVAATGAAAAAGATAGVAGAAAADAQSTITQPQQQGTAAAACKETSLLDKVASSMTTTKPNNNTCCLITALLCCLPLGCCALMHNRNAKRNYNNGYYGNARSSSNKATNYTGLACFLGSCGILIYLYRNDWQLPPFLTDLFDFK